MSFFSPLQVKLKLKTIDQVDLIQSFTCVLPVHGMHLREQIKDIRKYKKEFIILVSVTQADIQLIYFIIINDSKNKN